MAAAESVDAMHPGSGKELLRALVCMTSESQRDILTYLLGETEEFAVPACTEARETCVELVMNGSFDVIILDAELFDSWEQARDFLLQSGVTAKLLFVDDVEPPSGGERARYRRASFSLLPKRVFNEGETGRSHVLMRLRLLAARCADHRRVSSSRDLSAALERMRARRKHRED